MQTVQRPIVFQIEVTSRCNLACIMCPHPIMDRAKEDMDFDLFKTIIVRDALPQTKEMGFHFLGESTLHPRLPEMLRFATDHGIRAEMSTNGTTLTEGMAHALIDSGVKTLWLAIDGGTKEVHERIRVGSKWEKTSANVLRFLKINQDRGLPVDVIIQMVGQRASEDGVEDFQRMWEGHGAHVVVKFLDSFAGTVNLGEIPPPPEPRLPCPEPFERVAVQSNGDVVPCCRDWKGAYVYGNLREQSLEEIWHGVLAERLRQEHLIGNYVSEPCKSCLEWHIPMDRKLATDPDAEVRGQVQARLPNAILYDDALPQFVR